MIVFNFDILARPHQSVALRQPDPEGLRLWNQFHEVNLGRLGLVVDVEYEKDHLEHWLKLHGIKAAIYQTLYTEDPAMKADKVHLLMATVGKIEWYLDSDPLTCRETLARGIPTILVAAPYVVRPEWHDSKPARAWDELVVEVERQQTLWAERDWEKDK